MVEDIFATVTIEKKNNGKTIHAFPCFLTCILTNIQRTSLELQPSTVKLIKVTQMQQNITVACFDVWDCV